MSRTFVRRVTLPVPAREAFAWHERSGAFERLAPPWQRLRVLERSGGLRDGARVTLALPFGIRWTLEHRDYVEGERFRDVQRSGPFTRYEHTHRFEDGPGGCRLEDTVAFAAPFPGLTEPFIEGEFARLFAWRHRLTALDLAWFSEHPAPRRVLVTGATGLIGTALVAALGTQGHEVFRLVRRSTRAVGDILWDPRRGLLDPGPLEGFDAVVHLAGAGIADRPWSAERKRVLIESRVASTQLLARTLAGLGHPPRVLVSVSAIGYYGDRGDEHLAEDAPPGEGFLADLASRWEAAASPARLAGIRVVHPRIGLVLHPQGGALERMLPLFGLGLGGPLGSGRAWWSWITLDDLLFVIQRAIVDDRLAGPCNAVAPEPVRMRDFAAMLGRVLDRPAFLPAPAFALGALLGRERAEATLFASARVEPRRLADLGHRFRDPVLEIALRHLLGRTRP